MNETNRQEILALALVASDTTRDPQERLTSARNCLWLVQRTVSAEPARTLARAILSKLVDDLKGDRRAATFDAFGFWRDFPLTESNRLTHHSELRPEAAYACAQLLFDAARHRDALPFFDRALDHHVTAPTVLLACWNLEVLARENRSLEMAERALDYLNSRFAGVLSEPEYQAEVAHLSGHFLLLKGRFAPTETLGYEALGVHQLSKAAKLDPSYSSCFASSFAEYGDFLGSIEACLEIINRRSFDTLTLRDSTLVQLEVLFYLGYSLMAVGELERSRMCFSTFAEVTARLGLNEARDHARLFLVKLQLKQRSLLDFGTLELEKAYRELRALSFSAALSIPVGEECLRYEQMVKLLVTLAAARARGKLAQGELARLGGDALELLSNLSTQRPDLLAGVRALVGGTSLDKGAERVVSVIRQRLRGIPHLVIDHYQPASPLLRNISKGFSFLLYRVEEFSSETFTTMSSNVIPFAETTEWNDDVPTPEASIDMLLVGLAVVAIKRFWTQDQYVFGLVPCLESPATKFQHPKYELSAVL